LARLSMTTDENQLRTFFEEAFWMQHGESYPERHQANLTELNQKYPWPEPVIDSLYRITCHLDSLIEQIAQEIVNYDKSFMEGFHEIHAPVFFYISNETKKTRLGNSLANLNFQADFENKWNSCTLQSR
jgi:hypothetical protein